MNNNIFETTKLTTISRAPDRGTYDKDTIYQILDKAIDVIISYVEDGIPRAIPTGFVRIDDRIYIHGSVKSHFIMQLCKSPMACLAVSLLDGLVLARTAFNHSFNYRGVVAYAKPYLVEDEDQKLEVCRLFTEKLLPGRWDDNIKKPTPEEMKATAVMGFELTEVSAKIRSGHPKNPVKTEEFNAWTGHIPLQRIYGAPVPSPDLQEGVELPEYIKKVL